MIQAGTLPRITLATRITILRMMGIPVFVLMSVYYLMSISRAAPIETYRWVALGLFLVVAATDAIDGYLARSRNEITRLGKFLDPLADKMLLVSAIILYTRPGLPALEPQFPVWYTLLVLSRDLFLIVGAFVISLVAGKVEIHPRWTGKACTLLQMITIGWVLIAGPMGPFYWLIVISAAVVLFSWFQYLLDGLRQMEAHD